jgi:outer membrane protein
MPIAFALSAALFAMAFTAPAAAELKIGVISVPMLLRDAPQVKSANEKFKGEFQKREDDLKAEAKKLQDDDKKFQREADTMTGQQRANTAKDLQTRKIDFDLKQRQFAEQAQARNDELQRQVLERINQAIIDVAKERTLDLVLRDPAYATSVLDITSDVMKRLAAMEAQPAPAADSKKKKK